MPNQNSGGRTIDRTVAGLSAKGRWDYLPWYWTGYDLTENGPVANPLYGGAPYEPKENPGTPNPSVVPNAFFDTMLVNGTAYPYVKVGRKAYRLRILNACGDRSLNLQLYYTISDKVTRTGPGGRPELQADSRRGVDASAVGSATGGQPVGWPTDGRAGGAPDPKTIGPTMIQIGSDGGLLPRAVPLPNTPIGFELKAPTEAGMGGPTIVGITNRTLLLAPGERADVIVDFSQAPSGSKLILYNDAPAPAPLGDSRVDYYTADQDLTMIGGRRAPSRATGPTRAPSCSSRSTARPRRASTSSGCSALCRPPSPPHRSPILVPEAAYAAVYGGRDGPGGRTREGRHLVVHTTGPGLPADAAGAGQDGERAVRPRVTDARPPPWAWMRRSRPPARGRPSRTPRSTRRPVPLAGAERAGSPQLGDPTQVWRITHDGTESHSISFGAFNVQVLARARRDGDARPPRPRRAGLEGRRAIDPLESVLIALRPVLPRLPFKLEAGERPFDVTRPLGATGGFTELDQLTAAPDTVVNQTADVSWEAYWSMPLVGGRRKAAPCGRWSCKAVRRLPEGLPRPPEKARR